MANAAKATETVFEGLQVARHRVKIMAATDLAIEEPLHIGDWVEITIKGPVTGIEFESAKDHAVARQHRVTARQSTITEIAEPEDADQLEGQTKMATVTPLGEGQGPSSDPAED